MIFQDTWLVCEETVGPADYGNSLLSKTRKIEIKDTELYKKNNTTQVANFVISTILRTKKSYGSVEPLNTDPELWTALFMDQKARTGKSCRQRNCVKSWMVTPETLTCLMEHW